MAKLKKDKNISALKGIDVGVIFKGIDVLEVSFNTPNNLSLVPINITVGLGVEIKTDKNKKVVLVIMTVSLGNEDLSIIYGSIKACCIFEVVNFDEIFIFDGNLLTNNPVDFITTLVSISVSTMRGIVHQQFRGTFLHQAVMPIYDPQALAKDIGAHKIQRQS